MTWFNNLKISLKIIVSCLLFMAIIVVLSYQQYTSLSRADQEFSTFYADRFVPVRELNKFYKNLLQIRINMLQEKIAAEFQEWDTFEARLKNSEELREKNEKIWEEYMSTYLTDKEKELADSFIKDYREMMATGKEFVTMLRAGKIHEVRRSALPG